jgi:hypothetical protein
MFPELQVTADESEHWSGFLVTSLVSQAAVVILDEDGDYVWWGIVAVPPPSWGKTSSRALLGRAALARDGSGLRYLMANVEVSEDAAIHTLSPDGAELELIETPFAHHDFVELDDGTIAYLAFDPRVVDDIEVAGDRLMERAPDGTLRELYNAWDHYSFIPSGKGALAGDWPHANAIDYVAEDDAWLVGFLELGAIVEISRSTGQTLRTIGGIASDYTLPDGGTALFDTEHQFEWLGDGILVFINGGMELGAVSGVQEYTLDDASGTAQVAWSYEPDPPINCTNFGDVARLESGNTLVTFSLSGVVHEVDPDGALVWQLEGGVGGALGYLTRVGDLDLGAIGKDGLPAALPPG